MHQHWIGDGTYSRYFVLGPMNYKPKPFWLVQRVDYNARGEFSGSADVSEHPSLKAADTECKRQNADTTTR